MRCFDDRWTVEGVAREMRRQAFTGRLSGENQQRNKQYVDLCTAFHEPTRSDLVFYREFGSYVTEAWQGKLGWCLSLIVAFTTEQGKRAPSPWGRVNDWVVAFFGPDVDKAWCDKIHPGSEEVRCFHVFTDPDWKPIHLPTKRHEAYLRSLGWKYYEIPEEKHLHPEGDPIILTK